MFNAEYFTYDGKPCTEFGLVIADFDDSNVKETDAFSPTLSLLKAPGQVRFFHGKVEYDTEPTCEFSVISEEPLFGGARSVIMSWLVGRNEFKPLVFVGGDDVEFTYYCIFTGAKTIWVNGQCHGFRLTAELDSPFARGKGTEVQVGAGTHTVELFNKSDIDEYVYPIVEFQGSSIDIVNETDDVNRHFAFDGLPSVGVTIVDNELRHIFGEDDGPRLSHFTSKRWLRLRKGKNILRITASGTATIKCPYYAMIGY